MQSLDSSPLLQGFAANLQDPLSHLLVQLLAIIVAARLAGSLFKRLGLPAVVGEMAAGIALGPSLFGALFPAAAAFVFPTESLGTLKLLSQIGICLFMFSVGMELDLAHASLRFLYWRAFFRSAVCRRPFSAVPRSLAPPWTT